MSTFYRLIRPGGGGKSLVKVIDVSRKKGPMAMAPPPAVSETEQVKEGASVSKVNLKQRITNVLEDCQSHCASSPPVGFGPSGGYWRFLSSALDALADALAEEGREAVRAWGDPGHGGDEEGGGGEKIGVDIRYTVASTLMRLPIPVLPDIGADPDRRAVAAGIDTCLDLCGPRASLSAAVDCLGDVSIDGGKGTRASAESVATAAASMRAVRRALLALPGAGANYHVDVSAETPAIARLAEEVAVFDNSRGERRSGRTSCLSERPMDRGGDAVTTAAVMPLAEDPQLRLSMESLARLTVLLPIRIGSACHAVGLSLPTWSVRVRYCPRLVELSCFAACTTGSGGASTEFFRSLIRLMVHHGGSDHVAAGLKRCWDKIWEENDDERTRRRIFVSLVSDAISSVAPRDAAVLLRSVLWCSFSLLDEDQCHNLRPKASKKIDEQIWDWDAMAFLWDSCLCVLQNSDTIQNAFVRLVVLSPSSSQSTLRQSTVVTHIVVLMLASCAPGKYGVEVGGCEAYGGSKYAPPGQNDDEEGREGVRDSSVLMTHLLETVETWCEPVFIQRTDTVQQHHITEFVLNSLAYLNVTTGGESQQDIVSALISGVTNRLESSLTEVRMDGMRVGERMAIILGKKLHFEELDGSRDKESPELGSKKNGADYHEVSSVKNKKDLRSPQKARKKPKTPKDASVLMNGIDPDELYISDEDDSSTSAASNNLYNPNNSSSDDDSSSFESDSVWDNDDLVPHELSDDEEDLRPVPRPVYLRDCLSLLRAPENDSLAYDKHEAALKAIANIVRSSPPDLSDLAAALTRELIFMENKFNLEGFPELRWEGLCALCICAPVIVAQCLTKELFGSVSLGVRLDTLGIMENAAEELCGAAELRREREERQKKMRFVPQITWRFVS